MKLVPVGLMNCNRELEEKWSLGRSTIGSEEELQVLVTRSDIVYFDGLHYYILHNWEDEGCAKILEKCREAIPAEGGNVIIIEIVIDQDGDDDNLAQAKLSLDLDMMVCSGGRERTKDEWKKLLEKAGFSRIEIIPICGIQSVIVAQPYLFVPIYDSSSGG